MHLRIPEHAVHGFRTKATTDSGLQEKLDAMWRNRWSAWPRMGGRHPSESMVSMARIMHLSERDTERFVNENIPARFFLDLAFDRPAPDHSSLALYRKRLLKNGNWDSLQQMFDGLLQQARDKGLRLGGIQLVDSVHTQADVNNEKERMLITS